MEKIKKSKSGISLKHWLGYMCGDFGGCMTFGLMGTIVTRYYTNVLDVNSDVLFVLIILWNVWDAINDPLMGTLMDKIFSKANNPQGKFRPWILRSTPLVAVTAIAFWVLPTFFDGIKLILVLFLCKILYEGAYTMYNIPMGSLLSAMSTNDQERASLASARGVGSALGNAIPGIVGIEIIKNYGMDNAEGYRIVGVGCAAIGFVVCLLHYYFTEERNTRVLGNNEDNIKWSDVLVSLKQNRLFLALCVHGVCICVMQNMLESIASFTYEDVFGNGKLLEMRYPASSPAMILIFCLAPWLAKKIGLEKMIRYSLFVGGVAFTVLFVLVRVVEMDAVTFLIISSIAMGIPTVSIQMQWGLVAEAIDYNEVVLGKKSEGTIYGTFNLARRIGHGIGQGLAVKMLDWFQYDDKLAEANLPQSDLTVLGIQMTNAILPAFFIFGSWLAFKFIWKITPEIKQKIAQKKEEERILLENSKVNSETV